MKTEEPLEEIKKIEEKTEVENVEAEKSIEVVSANENQVCESPEPDSEKSSDSVFESSQRSSLPSLSGILSSFSGRGEFIIT